MWKSVLIFFFCTILLGYSFYLGYINWISFKTTLKATECVVIASKSPMYRQIISYVEYAIEGEPEPRSSFILEQRKSIRDTGDRFKCYYDPDARDHVYSYAPGATGLFWTIFFLAIGLLIVGGVAYCCIRDRRRRGKIIQENVMLKKKLNGEAEEPAKKQSNGRFSGLRDKFMW